MEFCDCISYKGKENMQEMLLLLKRYGFAGAIVLVKDDIFDEKIFESMILPREFKVFSGIEIFADSLSNLKKKVYKFRRRGDLLAVHGGNDKIDRMASREKEINLVRHTEGGHGIDHITARFAADNGVAMDFCLTALIYSRTSMPAILGKMRRNLMLMRKYKTPMILSTGGENKFDLRPPRQMTALSELFGMTREESLRSLKMPLEIVDKNRRYKEGRLIRDGVEIVR